MATIVWDSEKELEDYICNRLQDDKYCIVLGEFVSWWKRQVNLGPYGIADLVYFQTESESAATRSIITVVELKKEEITASAVVQLARYIRGIEHYLKILGARKKNRTIEVRGILVGTGYKAGSDVCYLVDSIPEIQFFVVDFEMGGGVRFEEKSGWINTTASKSDVDEMAAVIGGCIHNEVGIARHIAAYMRQKNTPAKLTLIEGGA